jgi:V/A-type H+-transporting ATPase subunit B
MNTMIRFYSAATDAEQKQIMAFDLSAYDRQLLKFGRLFRTRFMDIGASMPLEEALDLGWRTLADCFTADQLLMKRELVARYFPAEA